MPTETLRPNAGGTNTNLNYYDGSGHDPDPDQNYKQVNEEVADDDSTYVYRTGTAKYDTYNIPDSAVGKGAINFVKVYFRAKKHVGEAGQAAAVVYTHSNPYKGDEETLPGSYRDFSYQWSTNPHTGEAWTWEEINDLEIGVTLKPSNANLHCTQVYVEVDCEEPTLPEVTTNPSSSVGQTTATLNGTLDDDGEETCDCGFEYGETTDYGTTTATQRKETGETFSQEVRGLLPGRVYHFRAVATNSAGTSYGADRTFHTEALSAEAHQALGKSYPLARAEL